MMDWAFVLLMVECGLIIHLLVYSWMTGITPVPTGPRVRRAMLDSAPATIHGDILELGAGWGSLAFPLARRYPNCRVRAYEYSPIPWFFCLLRQALRPAPNLSLHRANFLHASFHGTGLVFCYLCPKGMRALAPKMKDELDAGAVVISNSFDIPGWRPQAVRRATDQFETSVFVYQLPASAAT